MSSQLSEQQISEYKDAFSLFDKDQDGSIDTSEIGTVIRSLNQNISQRELKDLIKEVDTSNKGSIDFPEFLTMMARKLKDGDHATDIKQAFNIFDEKKTGTISAKDLKHVLTSMGEKLTVEEADQLIKDANPDAQGRIHLDDFMRLMLAK
ncbi:calmodulin [Obelidium mucronatum]|nr:calmodulin [Obelidium mucronatum]